MGFSAEEQLARLYGYLSTTAPIALVAIVIPLWVCAAATIFIACRLFFGGPF